MKKEITNNEELARVRVDMSATVNVGNYEAIKYTVGISLPCKPADVDKTKKALDKMVEKYLKDKVKEIREEYHV